MHHALRRDDSHRPRWSSVDRLTIGAAILFAFAAVMLVRQALTAQWINSGGNCGFDGVQYCQMADGELAWPPYSRRVVTPLVVRLLNVGSVLDRFLVVNVAAAAVTTVLIFVLTRHLASGSTQRSIAAAVVATALVILNPFVWYIAMTYPALTDGLSLALGIGWLLVLGSRRPWWSVALAPLTILCREAWAPPMLLALVVCWFLLPGRRVVWGTNAAVVVLAAIAALNMPMVPGGFSDSFATVVHHQFDQHFTTKQGFARLLWMGTAGLGFVALLAIIRRRDPATRALTAVAIALAAGHVVMAILGGTDTERLLAPASAILTAVALSSVAKVRAADSALAAAVLASIVIWRPWRIVSPAPAAWLQVFATHATPWVEMRADLSIALDRLATIAIAVMLVAAASLLRRRRPRHSLG